MQNTLLPPNASDLERTLDFTAKEITENIPLQVADLWSIESAPDLFLIYLAWSVSVDNWNENWDETVKRNVIRESYQVHREKGTVASLKRALNALQVEAEITEWWQQDATVDPAEKLDVHEFQLKILVNNRLGQTSGGIITDKLQNQLRRFVDEIKPVRSHYNLVVGALFKSDNRVTTDAHMSAVLHLHGEAA